MDNEIWNFDELLHLNTGRRGSLGEFIVSHYYTSTGHNVQTTHAGQSDLSIDGQLFDVKATGKYLKTLDKTPEGGTYPIYQRNVRKEGVGIIYVKTYSDLTTVISIEGKLVHRYSPEEFKTLWFAWKTKRTVQRKKLTTVDQKYKDKRTALKAFARQTLNLNDKVRVLLWTKRMGYSNSITALPAIWPDNKDALIKFDKTVLLLSDDSYDKILEYWVIDHKDTATFLPLLRNDGRGKYRIMPKDFPKDRIHSLSGTANVDAKTAYQTSPIDKSFVKNTLGELKNLCHLHGRKCRIIYRNGIQTQLKFTKYGPANLIPTEEEAKQTDMTLVLWTEDYKRIHKIIAFNHSDVPTMPFYKHSIGARKEFLTLQLDKFPKENTFDSVEDFEKRFQW